MSEGAQKKQEKPRKFQAIRGTRDLLPPDTALWNRVEQTAREVFATFGYGEIRPPVFEATELFARGVGGDTDVVAKEMYKFEDFDTSEVLGLVEFRNAALSWADPLTRDTRPDMLAAGMGVVFMPFSAFVQGVSRLGLEAFRQGRIPATPDNERLLKELENGLGEFVARLNSRSLEESRQAVNGLKGLIGQLTFGDSLCLRPEATASVCRAYIQHNMQQSPQPVKLYYMGPMFRRERPQKGRYRQFYQIGAEVLEAVRPELAKDAGKELAKDAVVDAAVIEMLMAFFERIGLQATELSINSIGHAANNCRYGYIHLLWSKLHEVKDQLGADSQRRIETNPLRVLDSKLEHEQAIIAKLPHIADHLCDECKTHYAELKRQLDLRGVNYKENWRLVRGLDYYMRTTFEITARGLGSQDAVCGGGRYDGLVELLGGPPTKGIGFAIGEDRVILSLQEQKAQAAVTSREPVSIYIAWLGEKAYATALRAAKTLRAHGFRVEMPAAELKFGKALERASKLNARFALILGDDEVTSGQWTLKTLADGSQQKLTEAALLEYLRGL